PPRPPRGTHQLPLQICALLPPQARRSSLGDRLCQWVKFSPARAPLLQQCGAPRATEAFLSLVASFFPFLLHAFSPLQFLCSPLRVLSVFPGASLPSFLSAQILSHQWSPPLRLFSLPDLRLFLFAARRPFPRRFRWKLCRSRGGKGRRQHSRSRQISCARRRQHRS